MTMNSPIKLIAITGGSGAGKTWLANWLQRALGDNATRLALDDFYRDRSELPLEARAEINFDHPDAMDWPEFERVLDDCRRGCPTWTPRYDFATHTRRPAGNWLAPAPLVLVEGLWLLWHPRIAERFDLTLFLDCPAQLRLERRLARDRAERGRSAESVRAQFQNTVAPMHERFVAPQAAKADIVLSAPPGEAELGELLAIFEMELREGPAMITNLDPHEELQPT